MWLDESSGFQERFNLSLAQAAGRRCTAEHLVARQDGGTDASHNIAAACLTCNASRHNRRRPPSWFEFIEYVQRRVRRGRWLPANVLQAFDVAATRGMRQHRKSQTD
jgi:hypothetical protein